MSTPNCRVNLVASGCAVLDIRLRNGRAISGRADFAKGSPSIPMISQEVADKFLDCAAFAHFSRDKGEPWSR
jgi:hypothetical protein